MGTKVPFNFFYLPTWLGSLIRFHFISRVLSGHPLWDFLCFLSFDQRSRCHIFSHIRCMGTQGALQFFSIYPLGLDLSFGFISFLGSSRAPLFEIFLISYHLINAAGGTILAHIRSMGTKVPFTFFDLPTWLGALIRFHFISRVLSGHPLWDFLDFLSFDQRRCCHNFLYSILWTFDHPFCSWKKTW